MTGFGSIVIALALGSTLFPIPQLLTILVPLSVVMTSTLIIKHYRDIHFALLLKTILPAMGIGMVVGIVLVNYLQADALKAMFAILILWFAGRELYKIYRGIAVKPKPSWWQPIWTFFAGITHGLFASGGPLLVYALNTKGIPKAQFRATLVSVWFGLNVSYTIIMLAQQKVQPVLPVILAYIPVLALAVWAGSYLHDKVSDTGFRKVIYLLLIVSGLSMLLSTL
ncbi:sulfite exporter TauE/SafE family protein [Lysobacter sp. N42]|nr:sulfite exporter TauE/SafE family protein [Aliidiomarina sp. B3213]TCZ90326.1 sulfite exporter TauE/SafE family protein [Lysobacter sp. N42]